MAAFLGLVLYLLLAMALDNGGWRSRPNALAGEVERDDGLTCPQDCAYDYGLVGSTNGPVKRQLGSGSRVEDDRPRTSPIPVPVSALPPYANTTGTISSLPTDKPQVEVSYKTDAKRHSLSETLVFSNNNCGEFIKFSPCDAMPGNPLANTPEDESTTTATITTDREMTMTGVSTVTVTSHHPMTSTDSTTMTVTMPADPTATGLAASATPTAAPSHVANICAIAIPVVLTCLIALLILPCCIRRCAPRLWARLDRVLPLEDAYSGVAAVWARLKLTRQRNRVVRARSAGAGPAGQILTGDGRRVSGARWSEKVSEEGMDTGSGMGVLGHWRQMQEEKLRQVDARRARDDRWGFRPAVGVGGAGVSSMRPFEDVRRDELRRAREEKGIDA